MIKCNHCGKEHPKTISNCCWITCSCGRTICGQCGYAEEKWIDIGDPDSNPDDNCWCCNECPECGLQGCGMCV